MHEYKRECGRACEPTCDNPNADGCNEPCASYASCTCQKNYVRDIETMTCIKPQECY